MRLSVITPTCDRPDGLELAERWMARQTHQADEWIVADGGSVPAILTAGQVHLHLASPPGAENFLANIARGIDAATGDVIAFVEDDDWYAPTHLETLCRQLESSNVLAAGDDHQRYYHVHKRLFRFFQNKGASLCQTGFKRTALPALRSSLVACQRKRGYGVDAAFWAAIPVSQRALEWTHTVLGIKGLPGQPGLGIGHRPSGASWTSDPDGQHLREWIGTDADVYLRSRVSRFGTV